MVLGEELHTGGKALESDILAKKLNFFKNLAEHVQFIGNRVVVGGSVQGASTIDIYTCPVNTLYFIYTVNITDRNANVGITRSNVRILGETAFMSMQNNSSTIANQTIIFNPPIMLRSGEVIRLDKNNTNTNHEVNVSIMGFETSSEVSIQ